MDLRPYTSADRLACLEIFDSLLPAQINPATRPLLEAWLDGPLGAYFVMEHDGCIVGSGGYTISPDRTAATLEWGMVRRDSQRLGLGRFLLMYRIREIGGLGTVSLVVAHPPRPSAAFFEKQGFRPAGAGQDAWIKKLTVCS